MLLQKTGELEKEWNVLSLDSEAADEEGAEGYHKGQTFVWCIWGIVDGEVIDQTFYKPQDAVNYLFHTKRRWRHTILTGVNIDFDLNTLKYKGGYNWKGNYKMGKLIFAEPSDKEKEKRGWKKGDYLRVMDIGNFLLNTSLEGACKMFKISGHIDKHKISIYGKDEMIEACRSHAKTGALVMLELIKSIRAIGGNLRITGSSTALDLYQRKFLDKEYQIYDFKRQDAKRFYGFGKIQEIGGSYTNAEVDEAREAKLRYMKHIGKLAYVGGRCEIFDKGLFNNQDYLDINSSYPYQMRSKPFPDMNTFRLRAGNEENLRAVLKDFEGEAELTLKSPKNMYIPLLHTRDQNGRLIFPSGIVSGWYTFPEIRKALSVGYRIKEVSRIAIFNRQFGRFDKYIDTLMTLKVKPETKQAAKLLMNGLSGKFGQMDETDNNYEPIEEDENIIIDEKNYFSYNGITWRVVRDIKENEDGLMNLAVKAYPLIVAYITAYGRIQEYETMRAIGFKHVHYMDTDSIIADHEAVQKAIDAGKIKIDSKILGAYKREHTNCTVEIRDLKYYRYHENKGYYTDDCRYNAEENGVMSKNALEWRYHIKGVRASKQAEHWKNRKSLDFRVRKIKTAIRTNKPVNEFYSQLHKDSKPEYKRIFTGKQSEPIVLF